MTKEKQIKIVQDEMRESMMIYKDKFDDVILQIKLPVLPHD